MRSAPTLRPSYDEWRDFAAYVRKITPEIAAYGACLLLRNSTSRMQKMRHRTGCFYPTTW